VKTRNSWVLGSLLAALVSVAANPPVAMRVELEPLRSIEGKTDVEVVIQVSPEDRGRLGDNVIVRIELDGGAVSSGSPMRAVRLETDGSVRFNVVWPPGEYDLRVGIEDPRREDTGLWVGKVRIPDLSSAGSTVVATEPPSRIEAEPTRAPEKTVAPEVAVASVLAAPKPGSQVSPAPRSSPMSEPPTSPDTPSPVPETALESVPGPDVPTQIEEPPETLEVDTAPERQPEVREPEPGDEAQVIAAATAAEEAVAVAKPDTVGADSVKSTPESEETAVPVGDEPLPADEEPAEAEPPLVEPLRSEPPPRAPEPEMSAPSVVAPSAEVSAPVSAEVAARLDEWDGAAPETRDVSVIVTRGREAVRDLDENDLRLRLGGADASIVSLGGPDDAPLLLGFAIDVMSGDAGGWSASRGSLAPLADRAGGGRGRFFVATSSGVGEWGAEAGSSARMHGAPVGENVALLIVAALETFTGQRGRTFLIVLTDGRSEPTKEEWNHAADAAASAGVPILVIALWDEEFSNRTRKNLKQLTITSGGGLFLVQGRAQLPSAADRFGRMLDGSYALRFESPPESGGKPIPLSVSASDKDLDVSAPKSIR